MEYYGNNDFRYYQKTNDHLAHHGILGMHWGIRRFQPYPSDYKGNGKEVEEAKKRAQYRDLDNISTVMKKKKLSKMIERGDDISKIKRQSDKVLKSEQRDYDNAYRKQYIEIYNAGANYVNAHVDEFNKKWKKDFEGYSDWRKSPRYNDYVKDAFKFMEDSHEMMKRKYLGDRPS